jgi:hypothetical protein
MSVVGKITQTFGWLLRTDDGSLQNGFDATSYGFTSPC